MLRCVVLSLDMKKQTGSVWGKPGMYEHTSLYSSTAVVPIFRFMHALLLLRRKTMYQISWSKFVEAY